MFRQISIKHIIILGETTLSTASLFIQGHSGSVDSSSILVWGVVGVAYVKLML